MSRDVTGVAQAINELDKNIILIYAFNGTGKTRLSVAFKDLAKANNGGEHAGVYYNTYSEDLFYWDNDEENDGGDLRLMVQQSTLNKYHSLLDETNLRNKLALYKPNYDFRFEYKKGVRLDNWAIRNWERNLPALKVNGPAHLKMWAVYPATLNFATP